MRWDAEVRIFVRQFPGGSVRLIHPKPEPNG